MNLAEVYQHWRRNRHRQFEEVSRQDYGVKSMTGDISSNQMKLEEAKVLLGTIVDLAPQPSYRSTRTYGMGEGGRVVQCCYCKQWARTPPQIDHHPTCIIKKAQDFLNSFHTPF